MILHLLSLTILLLFAIVGKDVAYWQSFISTLEGGYVGDQMHLFMNKLLCYKILKASSC